MSYWALIGTADLQNDAVTTAKIATGAVTSTEIADDTIVNADINSAAAIAYSKLDLTGSIVPADFDASVTLDDFTAAGTVDMNSNQFSNLATATAAGQAVEYSQFAATLDGLSYKDAVVVASTANIDLTTGGLLTIDGVTLSAGDRVLVKDQTTPAENGIYEAAVGSWTRAADADTVDELQDGATTWVKQGTTQADTRWTQTATLVTLGTSTVSFAQTGSATTVTELSDLTDADTTGSVTGSILYDNAGTYVDSQNILLDDANSTIEFDGNVTIESDGAGTLTIDATAGDLVIPGTMTIGDSVDLNAPLSVQGTLYAEGGQRGAVRTESSNYNVVLATDWLIIADTSGGAVTVTLPASHPSGSEITVKRNGASDAIVATADADTIDGAASYTIGVDQRSITVVSDGTNWHIV